MDTDMTKKEALARFREEVMPHVPLYRGRLDAVALAEAWNNWTDSLVSEGVITRKQCDSWRNPF